MELLSSSLSNNSFNDRDIYYKYHNIDNSYFKYCKYFTDKTYIKLTFINYGSITSNCIYLNISIDIKDSIINNVLYIRATSIDIIPPNTILLITLINIENISLKYAVYLCITNGYCNSPNVMYLNTSNINFTTSVYLCSLSLLLYRAIELHNTLSYLKCLIIVDRGHNINPPLNLKNIEVYKYIYSVELYNNDTRVSICIIKDLINDEIEYI